MPCHQDRVRRNCARVDWFGMSELDAPLIAFDLSYRAYRLLRGAGMSDTTPGDVIRRMTDEALLQIPGLGRRTLAEIRKAFGSANVG